MAIVSKEDAKKMSKEEQERYCDWCWGHDFGDCDYCALYIKPQKPAQTNNNTPPVADK